jgi:hypothetical protein
MLKEKMLNLPSYSRKLSIPVIMGLSLLLSCTIDRSLQSPGSDLHTEATSNSTGYDKKITPHKHAAKKKEHPIVESEDIKKTGINRRVKKGLTAVKVRPEPSLKKNPIASLKVGDVIEVIGEEGNWIKVRFKEPNNRQIIGWINSSTTEPYRNNMERKNNTHKTRINESNETPPEQLSPM